MLGHGWIYCTYHLRRTACSMPKYGAHWQVFKVRARLAGGLLVGKVRVCIQRFAEHGKKVGEDFVEHRIRSQSIVNAPMLAGSPGVGFSPLSAGQHSPWSFRPGIPFPSADDSLTRKVKQATAFQRKYCLQTVISGLSRGFHLRALSTV